MKNRITIALLLLAVGLSLAALLRQPAVPRAKMAASAVTYSCYPNVAADAQRSGQPVPECHIGPFVVQEPAVTPGQPPVYNDFVVTDPSDAPQLWQGLNGLFEGTAPVCSTDRTLIHMVACIGGNLGNDGTGNPVIDLWTTSQTTEMPVIRMHVGSRTYVLTPQMLQWLARAMTIRPGW